MRDTWFRIFLLLHILGAIAAVGPTLTYGLWAYRADKAPEHRSYILDTISWVDGHLATPAFIAQEGRLGRSWGCPALSRDAASRVTYGLRQQVAEHSVRRFRRRRHDQDVAWFADLDRGVNHQVVAWTNLDGEGWAREPH